MRTHSIAALEYQKVRCREDNQTEHRAECDSLSVRSQTDLRYLWQFRAVHG
jgi:hypothetical protein